MNMKQKKEFSLASYDALWEMLKKLPHNKSIKAIEVTFHFQDGSGLLHSLTGDTLKRAIKK